MMSPWRSAACCLRVLGTNCTVLSLMHSLLTAKGNITALCRFALRCFLAKSCSGNAKAPFCPRDFDEHIPIALKAISKTRTRECHNPLTRPVWRKHQSTSADVPRNFKKFFSSATCPTCCITLCMQRALQTTFCFVWFHSNLKHVDANLRQDPHGQDYHSRR